MSIEGLKRLTALAWERFEYKNRSPSGQDQSEAVLHQQEYSVYADLLEGSNLEGALFSRDVEYRSICARINARVESSISIRRGGSAGSSWQSHRWLDPNRFSKEIEPKIRENLRKMETAAALLGRKGGQARTEQKAQAARENGKKGGRPKRE